MTVPSFEDELRELIHRCHRETQSDTPDHILAQYVAGCLSIFALITRARDDWHGFTPAHNGGAVQPGIVAAADDVELQACQAKLAHVRGFLTQIAAQQSPGYLSWPKVRDTANRLLADIDALAPGVNTA